MQSAGPRGTQIHNTPFTVFNYALEGEEEGVKGGLLLPCTAILIISWGGRRGGGGGGGVAVTEEGVGVRENNTPTVYQRSQKNTSHWSGC